MITSPKSAIWLITFASVVTLLLAGCEKGDDYYSRCVEPPALVESTLANAVWPGAELQGVQMVNIGDRLGGGQFTWLIGAWVDNGLVSEPSEIDIAIWATESGDGLNPLISIDHNAQLASADRLPRVDFSTGYDIVGSKAINGPVNCSLHALGLK